MMKVGLHRLQHLIVTQHWPLLHADVTTILQAILWEFCDPKLISIFLSIPVGWGYRTSSVHALSKTCKQCNQ